MSDRLPLQGKSDICISYALTKLGTQASINSLNLNLRLTWNRMNPKKLPSQKLPNAHHALLPPPSPEPHAKSDESPPGHSEPYASSAPSKATHTRLHQRSAGKSANIQHQQQKQSPKIKEILKQTFN
jgi:hypothetical protein